MSWNVFNSFPRQMGFPNRTRIVCNTKEFIDSINKNNGKTTVFTSLYSFEKLTESKPDFESAKISHIFLDLDNANSLENANKLHSLLNQKNLEHCIFFSGGGFHIYIRASPKELKNKKGTIFNAVLALADEVKLKIGINGDADIDAHCVGNIAQLVRVPNTYNFKRSRFCIPLKDSDLRLDFESIYKLSQSQRSFFSRSYGELPLDLSQYDGEAIEKTKFINEVDFGDSLNIDLDISSLPPCLQGLYTKKLFNHRCRYYIITYCKEIGLPIKDCIALLRKLLPPRTFNHCVYEESQPMWIYRRGDLGFPSCARLKEENLCVKTCEKYDS